MSAFAGKQTFRTINSNVRFILKADVQLMMILLILDSTQKTKDANSVQMRLYIDFTQGNQKECEADTGYRSKC